ncbi:MAG: hypothetical protein AAF141_09320 [Pseudomonadota bacterium]
MNQSGISNQEKPRPAASRRRGWNSLIIAVAALAIAVLLFLPNLLGAAEQSPRYAQQSILADPFGEPAFGQPMTPYALILRDDGTVRRASISSFAVDAVANGADVPVGTMFVVEVMSGFLEFGFVDTRQKLSDADPQGWSYGRFKPRQEGGVVDLSTRRAPDACHMCHAASGDGAPPYTFGLLKRFAETGRVQKVSCALGGREPCFSALGGSPHD